MDISIEYIAFLVKNDPATLEIFLKQLEETLGLVNPGHKLSNRGRRPKELSYEEMQQKIERMRQMDRTAYHLRKIKRATQYIPPPPDPSSEVLSSPVKLNIIPAPLVC